MPKKAKPWFRFYTEALRDPKIRKLAIPHRWLFVAVLGAARSSPLPGRLLITEDEPYETNDIADLAALTPKETQRGIDALAARGLIEWVDGAWQVTKWNRRQFESDTNAERMAKHRANRPPSDGDVTSQRGHSDGDVTSPENREQKTELLTPQDESSKPPDLIEEEFADWYSRYPRHEGRKAALRAYRTARRQGAAADQLTAGRDRYRTKLERERTQARFVKTPAAWLNGGCWDDEQVDPSTGTDSDIEYYTDVETTGLERPGAAPGSLSVTLEELERQEAEDEKRWQEYLAKESAS